jgi:hypothetical protein
MLPSAALNVVDSLAECPLRPCQVTRQFETVILRIQTRAMAGQG